MDRTASGCQPDQQDSPQVPAAELDQTLMLEFDSVLEEAGLASPDSAAADSADRSADQDPSSDEYSELTQDLTLQLDDSGTTMEIASCYGSSGAYDLAIALVS